MLPFAHTYIHLEDVVCPDDVHHCCPAVVCLSRRVSWQDKVQ